jgi:hypothetical protein
MRHAVHGVKAVFQSSHEADARALSSNHNAKQLILIRCKHSRGLENRLNAHWVGLVQKLRARDSLGLPSATAYRPENVQNAG